MIGENQILGDYRPLIYNDSNEKESLMKSIYINEVRRAAQKRKIQ
jgi:hypothetical protein